MLIVRLQDSFLIKEILLALWTLILWLLSTLTSSAHSACLPSPSSFSCFRVHLPVLGVCVPTTHISFCCTQCVIIVFHLSPWSDNPHPFLSSFNPYLSDPLTLPSFIHLSHDAVFPLFSLSHDAIVVLLILRELSHYLVVVTHHTSCTLGIIKV